MEIKPTIAIPYYESDVEKRDVLKRCLASFSGEGNILVLAGKQKNLPTAWNMCLDMAFGSGAEYVVLSNDDVELTKGNLSMLCHPNKVLLPTVNNEVFKIFHCHIFAMHKSVYEKVGKFDENFNIYWSDTDYAKRLVDAGIPVEINYDVDVSHPEPARTLKSYPSEIEQQDKAYFFSKWGKLYFDPISDTELK